MFRTLDKRNCGRLTLVGFLLGLSFGVTGAFADSGCNYTGGNWKAGSKIYHRICAPCHGFDGRGAVPGAPDFTRAGGALSHPHPLLAERIEHGFRGSNSSIAMPAKGGDPALTEQNLKDVHAYLHHAFGCGSGTRSSDK